jgi:hypothetical protein
MDSRERDKIQSGRAAEQEGPHVGKAGLEGRNPSHGGVVR